jgi:hypothetical protein
VRGFNVIIPYTRKIGWRNSLVCVARITLSLRLAYLAHRIEVLKSIGSYGLHIQYIESLRKFFVIEKDI